MRSLRRVEPLISLSHSFSTFSEFWFKTPARLLWFRFDWISLISEIALRPCAQRHDRLNTSYSVLGKQKTEFAGEKSKTKMCEIITQPRTCIPLLAEQSMLRR